MINGQQPPQQQRTYDGSLPITVTLNLMAWQQIINILQETAAPWKLTNPLITELGSKIESALQDVPTVDQQRAGSPAS